ncbi:hypothetical protein DMN91_001450 [Ooceraea biroi]|uniref:Chitin-binding type-2 domain-containing protein n=1 Tax=Ooceraea biroi TaxID=2015173 RepID=A0A026VTE5_OOCBI|nr:hypothetical protein X777_16720 [Ooceraea biroi]RLU27646.1 hypothetical protein DMN91_001450 [Ooceraea biroi]
MKGIYVIAIAFLACWSVITANENSDQDKSERSVFEGKQPSDEIPTRCLFHGKPSINSTIHLAHENDCTKYYKCFMSKRVEIECPIFGKREKRKLHFNTKEQVCDWPWHAGCTNCPGNPENGYPQTKISHETDDCNLYYECIDGEKHIRRCLNGLCFSRTCQACVQNRAGGNCDSSDHHRK